MPAPKKAKVSHEKMALKWSTVCGWRDGAMTTARMVDDAVLLARVFKEQKGQPQKQLQQDLTRSASSSSAGGGGASSSSSQASSSYTVSDSGGSSAGTVTEEAVQGAWKAATKGANMAPKFPGTLKLAGRATHSECELDMDLVTTFKGEDQPPSWECDSCESGCNHNVWKCSVCNTLYRVSRSSSMKEHFLQKEHLDNLDTKVLKQRADAANAPASSVTQVVRHDYSHLPAAVVRNVCISQAQAAQTHESTSRTLNSCAKLASTIRGSADASAISAELATMRKHNLHASIGIVQRTQALSATEVRNASGSKHVLARVPHTIGRVVAACAKLAKESMEGLLSECEVVSPAIDETTPPSAASKPVFCCLYACSFLFVWCCTFWATENIANSSGEQYYDKLKKVYTPFWTKLNAWGMDGCHSMRSTFAHGGVDGADGEGKSFLSSSTRRKKRRRERRGKRGRERNTSDMYCD